MLQFTGPFLRMSQFSESELPPFEPPIIEPDYQIILPSEAVITPSYWTRETQPGGRAVFLTKKPTPIGDDMKTLMRHLRVLRIGCIIGAELDPANAWLPFLNGPVIEKLVPWEFPHSSPHNFIVFDLYTPSGAGGTMSPQDQADWEEIQAWSNEFEGFHANSVLQFNNVVDADE